MTGAVLPDREALRARARRRVAAYFPEDTGSDLPADTGPAPDRIKPKGPTPSDGDTPADIPGDTGAAELADRKRRGAEAAFPPDDAPSAPVCAAHADREAVGVTRAGVRLCAPCARHNADLRPVPAGTAPDAPGAPVCAYCGARPTASTLSADDACFACDTAARAD